MEFVTSETNRGSYIRLEDAHPDVAGVIEDMYNKTWKARGFNGGDMHSGNWGYAEDWRVVCFDPDSSEATIPQTKIGLKSKRLHGCGRGRWAQ